jgi:trehalose 6-phosphate phosphatase
MLMPLRHLWKEAFPDVRRWACAAQRHSLLLDFDGTLTPVVRDPDCAFPDAPVRRFLTEIQDSGRIAVGVISGLDLEDVQALVGVRGIVYAGNHGMEIMGPGIRFVDDDALVSRDGIHLLASRIKNDLKRFDHIQIQNKGLSVTIHWSTPQCPDKRQAIRNVVIDAVADGKGRFAVRDAKDGFEILPGTDWNNGSAALRINTHIGVASRNSMYVGDNCTDEDAFETLREAITVKVERLSRPTHDTCSIILRKF